MMWCKKSSIIILLILIVLSVIRIFAGSNVNLEKGIKLFEAKKYAEDRKKMKLTHVRYLPEKQAVLSAINMYLDYSLIFDYSKTPSVIQIKSKSITYNFKQYFE